jgi:two-component system response regulator YesN
MIKAVIVEDEMLVRLGMKTSIESSDIIEVAGAFSSAEEAQTYFENNHADVLVTDIRLPGMSGLDLIERVRESHPGMVIIVLSCYDDFSYARRAYELGIDKYLLKHELAPEQLLNEIIELTANREKETGHEQTAGTIDGGCLKKKYENVHYRLCIVNLRENEEPRFSDIDDISFPMLSEVIQQILDNDSSGECFIRHEREIFCILAVSNASTEQEEIQTVERIYEQIGRHVSRFFSRRLYMSVSDPYTSLEHTRESYEQAVEIMKMAFYHENAVLLLSDAIHVSGAGDRRFSYQPDQIFLQDGGEKLKSSLYEYLAFYNANHLQPAGFKVGIDHFLMEFRAYIQNIYQINPDDIAGMTFDYRTIEKYAFAEPLLSGILNAVSMVADTVRKMERPAFIIASAMQYIDSHYTEDISLESMAGQFHMNTNYFGQLFKKEAKVNFINYLNDKRMECAKKMLIQTDATGEEIAYSIGITNVNYFFRLFKKRTGMTIKEYRQMHETEKSE